MPRIRRDRQQSIDPVLVLVMSYFAINTSFCAAWLKISGERIAARARLIFQKIVC